ncbi:hypothetical protein M885DRAFT_612079 [Pelagophyceae sp. CCMP2097]|nr:hypothetical protein M885DRAFT_612079 [Pelagophyceae sp. CCMP2097]|mmetsp:Transcript_16893/g.57149  ORF Transcript_16893/g.57149 Transcript_16893/m.57149 type:complete len:223 (-) Transcript_16893:25-693(-)
MAPVGKEEIGRNAFRNRKQKERLKARGVSKPKTEKNKIRDLRRRIQLEKKKGGTAEAIAALEADIALRSTSEGAKEAERKKVEIQKANATKYHKVKFFERRKIDRSLRQVQKKLLTSPADAALVAEEARLFGDLSYVKFYPNEHKYISLFGAEVSGEPDDEKTIRRREDMRKIALARAAEDALKPKEVKQKDEESEEDDDEESEEEKDEEEEAGDGNFFVNS